MARTPRKTTGKRKKARKGKSLANKKKQSKRKTTTLKIRKKKGRIFPRRKTKISKIYKQLKKYHKRYRSQRKKFLKKLTRRIKKQKRLALKLVWRRPKKNLQKKIKKLKTRIRRSYKKTIKRWKKALSRLSRSIRKIRSKRKTRSLGHPIYSAFFANPKLTIFSLTLTALIFTGAYTTYQEVFKDLPSPLELTKKEQFVSSHIYDRNGKLLFTIYEDENRTPVPLSQVSKHLVNATIAIEDQNFYKHHGFSPKGITRAMIANSKGLPTQGGSTLTQQLVKNRLLNPEKTIKRKAKELVLAVLVDTTYTKDEILTMYLNTVSYGGTTYGIQEASLRYFGVPAKDLDIAQSAMLAGLTAAPSLYNPFSPTPGFAYARQEEVLRRMVEDGFISQEEAGVARRQVLRFREDSIDIKAPHFVMYVRDILKNLYGEEMLRKGGLQIRTTLDLGLHNQAQSVLTTEVDQLDRLRVSNGASLITNPQTGEVLSMVGSKDYFNFTNDGQVNVTLRPRQPGSSIKPLTYALAFEKGSNPLTRIDDASFTYYPIGGPPYSPRNYDGKFHGRVTLKQALASSYNVPAVKLLASLGVGPLIDKGEAMGITTWQARERFGLSLTLGGGEVRMVDMAQLYGTFATNGVNRKLNPLLEIKNAQGETLYKNTCALEQKDCTGDQALDARVAYQITDILSDNLARTPAFGPRSVLFIPNQQVAVKTGTTNSLRDNWTIGYTSDRLVAVWVGNNDNKPMSYIASGITGASPIWNETMRLLLDEENPHSFATPSGMVKIPVCQTSGTINCGGCRVVKEEYFLPESLPPKTCHRRVIKPKVNPTLPRDQILEGISR